MDIKLDEQLCKDFPILYKDRNGDMRSTCMVWGFDCGDGWHGILRALSSGIAHATSPHVSGRGAKAWTENESGYYECGFNIVVDQVKEKYSSLRYYVHSEPKPGVPPEAVDEEYAIEIMGQIDGLIHMAESMSSITCEACGNPGTMNNGGWLSVRCVPCRTKENA